MFLTLDDLDAHGKTILVRADLNVPLSDAGEVEDDFRIVASLQTIQELRVAEARVVVASHLGRPKGHPDPALSLAPVAHRLGELGGFAVAMAQDVAGPHTKELIGAAGPADVVVMENTRFEPGEAANDGHFADRLASLADAFVLDAFGSAHRAHASTVGVAQRIRSAAGRLVEAEVAAFSRILGRPERPFVVLLGGAKVSGKLGVMRTLLPKVDAMLLGGAMCFTVLAAEGFEVGESLVEDDMIDEVRSVLSSEWGGRVSLPVDIVVGDRFAEDAATKIVPATAMPADWVGMDIGPATAERFAQILAGSDTIFWNGPMGVFEWEQFAAGTRRMAEGVAESDGYTVAGGGDSVAALRSFGLEHAVTHISTGGGAGLELLEGESLPALEALARWKHGA